MLSSVHAQTEDRRLQEAARREGRLVVYGTLDMAAARAIMRSFQDRYPGIQVDYQEVNSTELHHRYLAETQRNSPSADVLWSSAMDLQVKLVNDGYATPLKLSEAARLPAWAEWRSEAFGTTFEPVVLVYNRRMLKAADVPTRHDALAQTLNAASAKWLGRVCTYDIARSGLGFLLAAQDVSASANAWDLFKALGAARTRLYSNTSTMIDRVSAGEHWLAYNVLGSYAALRARTDPSIGVLHMTDWTLVVSRIALLSRQARHPAAGRLFIEYMVSAQGQTVLAQETELFSLRDDVVAERSVGALQRVSGRALRPIQIGPGLLAHIDQSTRKGFLNRWQRAFAPGES